MEKIIKNGKEFLRFRIGDEFEAISGKGSFNEMKKEGLASDKYDEDKGFIYPLYDGSTKNEHIKGYATILNINKPFIKVSTVGNGIYKKRMGKSVFDPTPAGNSLYVCKKAYLAQRSFGIISKKNNLLPNFFIGNLFNKIFPRNEQGTNGVHTIF